MLEELVDWSTFSRMRTELGASFVRILGYFREDGEKAVAKIEDASTPPRDWPGPARAR